MYEIGRKRLRKTLLKDSLWWVKAEKRKMYFTERLFTMNLDSSNVIDHAGLNRISESFKSRPDQEMLDDIVNRIRN